MSDCVVEREGEGGVIVFLLQLAQHLLSLDEAGDVLGAGCGVGEDDEHVEGQISVDPPAGDLGSKQRLGEEHVVLRAHVQGLKEFLALARRAARDHRR
jgi:hypothetical protein